MDPITHSFAGAALARAGLQRAGPLATATAVVAANAPDIDVLVYAFGDEWDGLAFRRGITHGAPAWLVLPLLVVGGMMLWDRWVRRRDPSAAPARPGPLLLVAFMAVLTHPALDWLNTYGIRLLSPLSGRWFYGDALFIVDPWLWLLLGGAVYIVAPVRGRGAWLWAAFWAAATALVLAAPVGWVAQAAWLLGVAAVVTLAWLRRPAGAGERLVGNAIVIALGYVLLMIFASRVGAARVLEAARQAGLDPVEAVVVGPAPADPLLGEAVVQTKGAYYRGFVDWAAGGAITLPRADSVPRATGDAAAIRAAAASPAGRDFLTWSRFPVFAATPAGDGWLVRISDMRYDAGDGWARLVVRVDGR